MAEKKKEIRRIEIEPAENGGHTVTHHYHPMQHQGRHGVQESYVEPETHVFGKGEHEDMLAHVANHLDLPEPKEEDGDDEEPDEDEDDKDEPKGRMTRSKAKRVSEAA